jgi:drug/metabolite transporter (DMT)-like permease
LKSYLFLAASMALVGSYVGLSKVLVAVFPVFLLMGLRYGIAGVAMLPWLRRPATEPPLSPGTHGALFLCSFLGNFLFSICMLKGVQATSALAAGVVMAGIPAAVALLSRIFLGEKLSPRVAAGIACAGAGVALMALARGGDYSPSTGPSTGPNAGPWWGYALLLAAVFCEASYVVVGKRLTGSLSPKRISALINVWGLLLVAPLAVLEAPSFAWTTVATPHWALLLFYALAASVGTVWLWMRGLQGVPASQAGVFTVMLPLSAAAVGLGLLGEQAGALHGVALGLGLAGVLLATLPAKTQRRGERVLGEIRP